MLAHLTRHPPRVGRGLALALTLGGALLAASACNDVLSPPRTRPISVADSAAPPPFAVTGEVAGDLSGDYVAPIIDPIWVKGSTPIGTSSASLLYKITVKGKLERTSSEAVAYTAYGARACKGGVDVVTNWSTNVWATWCLGAGELGEYTKFARLTGPTSLYRSQADQVYGCGPLDDQWCYAFQDAEPMTASIRRVPGKIVVRPGFAAAKYNTSVHFTMDIVAVNQADSAATAGIIPFTSTSWTFTPDTGAVQSWSCNTFCDRTLTKSGWLKVKSTVNGEPQEVNIRIKVFVNATVTADSSSVYVGNAVAFTTRLDGEEAPGQDWTWTGIAADTGANCTAGSTSSTCRRLMSAPGTGTMGANVRLADGTLLPATSKSVQVRLPVLSLSSDLTKVGEGDSVHFVGNLSPMPASYAVESWSWQSDSAPPILATRGARQTPRLTRNGVTPKRRGAVEQWTFSLEEESLPAQDDMMHSEVSAATTPGSSPATLIAPTSELRTYGLINGPGTVTLTVRVGGVRLTASTHITVEYLCPEAFPVDDVLDEIVTAQSVPSHSRRFGRPTGSHTVTFYGPWTVHKYLGVTAGYPEAAYRPRKGKDLDGQHTVAIMPYDFSAVGGPRNPEGSWVVFICKVSLSARSGKLKGKMAFQGSVYFDLAWYPPIVEP